MQPTRSFKFAPTIVARKKARQQNGNLPLKVAFMVRDLSAWESPDPPVFDLAVILDTRGFVSKQIPIPEVRTKRDLEICRKIYDSSFRIGDNAPGWEITYSQEFNMTSDSTHFPPRDKWEAKGYRPDVFGCWIGPDGDVGLPLYQGGMIHQFDFSQKCWASGLAHAASWEPTATDNKVPRAAVSDGERLFLDLQPKVDSWNQNRLS